MPTFANKESGLSVRNKLNDVIIAIEKIDTGDVAKVADIEQEVKDIAAIDAEVSTVAGISSDVSTVSTNVSDVQTVASDLNETTSDIEVVSADITNVNNVGSNIGNVNTVAGISTDVTAVAGDEADIGIVASDITNVNTVSASISDVNTTAASISDVETVSTNISDVSTTAGSISDVQTVASDLNEVTSDIDVVSTNISDVNTVSANITNVNSVGTNISDVNTVADALEQPLSAASGVSYDNASSGLSATDVQSAIDDVVALSPGTKQQIAQGFIQREQTRGDLDVDLAVAIELNLLGAPVAGGYYAGLIDTLTGNIIAADDYQTGLRYALIVSDKSLEGGRGASPASGLPTGDLRWDALDRTGEAGCFTRWNGLDATNVIITKNDTSYEVHDFIEAVRSQYPAATTPGGSEWYLPAMDELELLYRNFKPNNADNFTGDRSYAFPGTQVVGTNPSSDPNGIPYENSPRIPGVTFLDLFKEGNAQAVDLARYWSTTDADEEGRAWNQDFTISGRYGFQFANLKDAANASLRPVRRVVLS